MDHVVYADAKEKDFQKLLEGKKRMVVRAAMGRRLPYGQVNIGDRLYLIENNGDGRVHAQAKVSFVLNSEKLSKDESRQLIEAYQDELQLSAEQFNRVIGRRYIVLVCVTNVQAVPSFLIDRCEFGNMDDWLPVEDIERVKLADPISK
jgi:hypothetical protein